MGLIDKLDEWEKKIDESRRKDKEKSKKETKKNQESGPKAETEKLAKEGRFIVKGAAFWLMIPFFAIVAILLVLFGAWILQLLGILQ